MCCAFRDGLAQLLLRGLSKTRQFSDAPLFTRLLQLLDRADPKLIVKSFYLFGTEAGQCKQLENSRRKLCAKFFEIFERTARSEFLDLLRDAFSDSWNFR